MNAQGGFQDTVDTMNKKFQFCLITDHEAYTQPFHEVAQHAEETGVDYFLLRQKGMGPRELLDVARHLRPMFTKTRFIVHGQLDVALATEADGIHLQKGNIPVKSVRSKYPNFLIGYSAHSPEELEMAEQEGASYVFISPVFPLRSKESDFMPIGLKTLSEWIKKRKIPIFALGGITRENIQSLKEIGCIGVAGISLFVKNGYFTDEALRSI
jgi:thiamine-phosphate pyrophosphorylase